MRQNILCDFLNKEIRRLYGLYHNLSPSDHERVLRQWINAALILAPDWCLVPIGFLAESSMLQRVIVSREDLLFTRAMRLAMRDAEIDSFVQRRRQHYMPYKGDYPSLFQDDTIKLLQRYARALHARSGQSALSIGKQWSVTIVESPKLEEVRRALVPDQLLQIAGLPSRIAEEGLGLTWNAISERLPPIDRLTAQPLRRVLHADLVRGYLREYNLAVLTRLPYGWRDLDVQQVGGYFDYEWLDASLGAVPKLLPMLLDLSAQALLQLRAEPGFSEFQERYSRICETVQSPHELRRAFGRSGQDLGKTLSDLMNMLSTSREPAEVTFIGEGSALAGYLLAELSRRASANLGVPLAGGAVNYLAGPRVFLEDLDSFEKMKGVLPIAVEHHLKDGRIELSEDYVQSQIETILNVPFHKIDWGGEINDLYTANVRIEGRQIPTAFMLKGKGLKAAAMQIADCGKNGDQLQRLLTSPAELFVVQYVGPIAEAVISDMEGKIRAARAEGKRALFCIVDGQETARLLRAYGKI